MIVPMPAQGTFCRLVLGDPAAAAAAAEAARPADGLVEEVAAAWAACGPELARRRTALSWEDPPAAPGTPGVVQRLQGLPDLERAAVAAQALGLDAAGIEAALGAGAGEAPGLLARGHAALAGLGLPEGERCARERERLAVAEPPRTDHADGGCATFAEAVEDQRAALAAVAEDRPVPEGGRAPDGPRRSRRPRRRERPARGGSPFAVLRRGPREAGSHPAPLEGEAPAEPRRARPDAAALAARAGALVDQTARGPRIAVALGAALLGGLVGFGVVSAFERDEPDRGSQVVTATPVGPLPPGVGPTNP